MSREKGEGRGRTSEVSVYLKNEYIQSHQEKHSRTLEQFELKRQENI